MNEQDIQKIITMCEVYKTRIEKLEHVTEDQEKRIVELEKSNTKTDIQYALIMEKLDKLVEQTIPELSKEIQEIKEKPVKRYDTVITSSIGAFVGGVIGYILGQLFHS